MKTHLLTGVAFATLLAAPSAQRQTHGTMIGSLSPNSVVVWTRADQVADISILWNSTPNLSTAAETAAVRVKSSDDFIAHIKLTGLLPGLTYYCASKVKNPSNSNTSISPWHKFTTPPASTTNGKLRFIASGDMLDPNQYGIFDQMAKHPANFYLSLGDMPYADNGASLAAYWKRHRDTRKDSRFIDFQRRYPVEAMWDDHEVINDWDKNTPSNIVGWGKQAFFDYLPFPKGTTRMYRTLRWGKGAEIWFLDCRSFRDSNVAPVTASKTMLGATQKAWLKNTLLASNATFKIICSSVPVRWGKTGADDWSGFPLEREEIFDFIVKNKIRNVVIVSADSHLISLHHHREGIREYQCGPVAAATRPQVPASPEVRFRASTTNFLLVDLDPTVTPAKMRFEYYDATNNKLYTDELLAQEPATGQVFTDLPAGICTLQGPHHFRHRGDVAIPNLPPGPYRIGFEPDAGNIHVPNEISVTVPTGSDVVVGGRWRELPGAKVLFADRFNGPLTGYTVIDETTTNAPSAWFTSGGELLQSGFIGGAKGSVDSDRPGTLLVTGNRQWKNYTTTARMDSKEDGRIGVLFRFQDKNNYYRFFMDAETPVMRLEKKVNGVYSTLKEIVRPYVPHNQYDIRCIANGSKLKVYIEDQLLLEATDSTIQSGKVGFYVWRNRVTEIDDLVVTEGDDFQAPVNKVFVDDFEDFQLKGWAVQDHAQQTGASNWVETIGVLMQLNNIGDLDPNNAIAKPGTVCVATAAVPNDVQFTVDMLNYDDDGMGLVFRYKDAANHYRFSWNRLLRERQLQKVVNGNWSVLWSEDRDYNPAQWYRVRIETVKDRLRIWVDSELIADVVDGTHKSGTVGLYSWSSAPVLFDRALIQKPHTKVPAIVAVTKNRETKIYGRSSEDPNRVYGVGMALTRSPGLPLNLLDPTDTRTLNLTPDFLFQASIRPNPMFSNFIGRLDGAGQFEATIHWPNIAGLKGVGLHVSGWTLSPSGTAVNNLFPSVRVIFP